MTYSSNTYSDTTLAALRASDATPAAVLASDFRPAPLRVVNGGRRPGANPGLLYRLITAVLEPQARLYNQAVTDPTTGRPDPALERAVGRMMMGL